MPISDELAALRALGTVKAKSTRLLFTEDNYVFTTPQQQELLRKEKARQEKAAREEAEKYLRQHSAGGQDLWYKKLRELRARKLAGRRAAWEESQDACCGNGEEEKDEEDVGLEVEMLPEHLVKALKAKYETENAAEALDRALKEEEEGKGTILSEVMADMDAAEAEAGDDENFAGESRTDPDTTNPEPGTGYDEQPEQQATTEDPGPVESPDAEAKEERADRESLENEPVEEVRSKIEQLSIDDAEFKSSDDERKGAAIESLTTDEHYQANNEHSGEVTDNDNTISSEEEQIPQTKLFYNTESKLFISIIGKESNLSCSLLSILQDKQPLVDGDDPAKSSETLIDLSDPKRRGLLNEEQIAQAKGQMIALQDQINYLMANW